MSAPLNDGRDPREVEMLAIVNMQPVPDEVRQHIAELDAKRANENVPNATEPESDDDEVADAFLTPGTRIRPDVGVEDARKLAERLYGIVAGTITELDSYDDRNFLIKSDSNVRNPIIANRWPHGYVLKITNALGSRQKALIDAQTQLMIFLDQQNIRCPRPVMNIHGKYFSHERLSDEPDAAPNCVRLLEFVPGTVLAAVPDKSANLFYQAGQFVGRLNTALRHFENGAFERQRSIWQLDAVPRLKEFVFALRDESHQELVELVIEQFERRVLDADERFARGIIHGDFNEHNVLAERPTGGDWRVSAVIDFGDSTRSAYVFELAIAMCYMMLQTGDLSTGGLVLAGYGTVRPVPEHERNVLRVCVAARLCQSLVLGAYSHSLDPDNAYVLSTQAVGWRLLEQLWAEPELQVLELWQTTADRYLTQSTK